MLNKHYNDLQDSYLFSTINKKIRAFQEQNPDKKILRLGIGDVTEPLAPSVIEAMHKAVDEQTSSATFRGYGPETGYDFLQQALGDYYRQFGVDLPNENFIISDGAKSDVANILDIFADDIIVAIPDPVYPVYMDTNIMTGHEVTLMKAGKHNDFRPMPQDVDPRAQVIYLCSPNNPSGAAYSKEELQAWVDYANEKNAIILYDAAYEAFVQDASIPRSIFVIPGAKECAIEFGSFSKTAGFTGTRLSYTVIDKALERDAMNVWGMWVRRQSTKFNGAPYIIQRAGEAALSPQGVKEMADILAIYRGNAQCMMDTLDRLGVYYTGGEHSPYVWMACPEGMDSWRFFDYLLEEIQLVGTPGAGFGACGEGFFRLSSFAAPDDVKEAMHRLENLLKRA